MKEKIEWYQEVLELEPSSKVFFPLARLLAGSDQLDRAVCTLRHGLDRHPEFIEARLYLIDLLFRHGRLDQCEEQLGQLSPLFSRYEGFWQAWGNSLSVAGKEGDVGLALMFLAAAFQRRSLSLSDVLSKGLEAVLHQEQDGACKEAGGATLPRASRGPVPSAAVTSVPSSLGGRVQSLSVEPSSSIPPACHCAQVNAQSGARSEMTIQSCAAPEKHVPQEYVQDDMDLQGEGEEGEERFSLRTRSMAEVLAEQGDYAGALEIYQELSSQAVSPEEAADLQYRMSTLTAHLGAVQESVPDPEPVASPGKHRVLTVLEALAERLESRVHG